MSLPSEFNYPHISPHRPRSFRYTPLFTAVVLIIFVILAHDSLKPFPQDRLILGDGALRFGEKVSGIVKHRPSHPPADDDEHIAMCTMVKATPFFKPVLDEWLTHHYHHHGIRRFYIVDDGSNPPLENQTYSIPSSAVSIIETIPDGSIPEGVIRERLYEDRMYKCVEKARGKHDWVGLIDIDEFLEMRNPSIFPTLQQWLQFWQSQRGVGAVAIQTLSHSSAGRIKQPIEGFRKGFTRCIDNTTYPEKDKILGITQMKQFIRPKAFTGFMSSIHDVTLIDGYFRVAETGEEQNAVKRSPKSYQYWALHHYSSGSREHFEKKAEMGDSHGKNIWTIDEGYWNVYHKNVEEYDCKEMTLYDP